MRSYQEYLVDEAQEHDELAHSQSDNPCEHRTKAFEARREARQNPIDAFEKHPEGSIDGSVALLSSLANSDRLSETESKDLLNTITHIKSNK